MAENPKSFRRVVTGNDENGRSGVLFDSAAPNVQNRGGAGFPCMTEFWCFDDSPVPIAGTRDDGQPPFASHPTERGAYLRFVEFDPPPPGYDQASDPDAVPPHPAEEDDETGWGDRGGRAAGSSPIHRTRSVDYGTVLEANIKLVLDDTETLMQKGDTAIQLGDYHQWVTQGTSCIMSFVMIGGTYD